EPTPAQGLENLESPHPFADEWLAGHGTSLRSRRRGRRSRAGPDTLRSSPQRRGRRSGSRYPVMVRVIPPPVAVMVRNPGTALRGMRTAAWRLPPPSVGKVPSVTAGLSNVTVTVVPPGKPLAVTV